jgi:hypothetical protein
MTEPNPKKASTWDVLLKLSPEAELVALYAGLYPGAYTPASLGEELGLSRGQMVGALWWLDHFGVLTTRWPLVLNRRGLDLAVVLEAVRYPRSAA